MSFPQRQAAVVGVYTTEQARFMERSSHSLQVEAIQGALDDAGLTLADIDGVVAPNSGATNGNAWGEQFWATQLGGRALTFGQGLTASLGAQKAALAVSAGMANVVVVFWGKSHRQTGPAGQPIPDQAPRLDAWNRGMTGATAMMWYAMWARRYMHEFGVTNEDLAHVGVTHRYHATLNPNALMCNRGELTIEDVVESPMIAEPLHLFDCSLDNDGGWAIVIASAEIARNCKRKPVWVIGGAEGIETDVYMTVDAPWIRPSGSAVQRVGDISFSQAGITREDVDVANLYDCFSITMIRDLEELGFCKLGEGVEYFKEGHTRLGGSMPCNTDGGLLSHSHPGMPHGLQTIEVTRQLRGECGARQVPGAKIGLAFAQGASVHGHCGSLVLAAD